MAEENTQHTHDEENNEQVAQEQSSASEKSKEEEYLDGWKRAKADLINYKKEEEKRFSAVLQFANEQIIRELITVLDSFDLAIETMAKEDKVEKGIYLIRAQLEDALKRHGLERVVVSVDTPFDPALQEALATVESEKESGTVVEEVERGYMLNGKLIRPARVKVAK